MALRLRGRLALLTRKLLLALPQLIAAQQACLQRPVSYGVIHERAVSINTAFTPYPEAALTISNAPTSIDGVTTFTWTETKTYTS